VADEARKGTGEGQRKGKDKRGNEEEGEGMGKVAARAVGLLPRWAAGVPVNPQTLNPKP